MAITVSPAAAAGPVADARSPAQQWQDLTRDYGVAGHPDPARGDAPGFFDAWDPVTAADVHCLRDVLGHYADAPGTAAGGRHSDFHARLRQMAETLIKLNPTLRQSPRKALATLVALMEMQVHAVDRQGLLERSRPLEPEDLRRVARNIGWWDFLGTLTGGMVGYTGAWFSGGMVGISLRDQGVLDATQRGASSAWTISLGYTAGQTFVPTLGLTQRFSQGVGHVDGKGQVAPDHYTVRGLFWGFVAYALFFASMLGTRWMMPVPKPGEASPEAINAAARDQDTLRAALGYLATLGVVLARFVLAPSRRIHPWLEVDLRQETAAGAAGALRAADGKALPAGSTAAALDPAALAAVRGTLHEFGGFASRHSLGAPRLDDRLMPLGAVVRTLVCRWGQGVLENLAIALARLVPLRRGIGCVGHIESLFINGATVAMLFTIVDQYQLAAGQTPSGKADPYTVDASAVAGVLAGWGAATLIAKHLRTKDPLALRDGKVDTARRRLDMSAWGDALGRATARQIVAEDFTSPVRSKQVGLLASPPGTVPPPPPRSASSVESKHGSRRGSGQLTVVHQVAAATPAASGSSSSSASSASASGPSGGRGTAGSTSVRRTLTFPEPAPLKDGKYEKDGKPEKRARDGKEGDA